MKCDKSGEKKVASKTLDIGKFEEKKCRISFHFISMFMGALYMFCPHSILITIEIKQQQQ